MKIGGFQKVVSRNASTFETNHLEGGGTREYEASAYRRMKLPIHAELHSGTALLAIAMALMRMSLTEILAGFSPGAACFANEAFTLSRSFRTSSNSTSTVR